MADEDAVVLRPAPRHFKSKVWNNFGFNTMPGKQAELDMGHAVCKLCNQLVKYCGNTTNLGQHLDRHHPDLDRQIRHHPAIKRVAANSPQQQPLGQQTIEDSLQSLPSNSAKAKRISTSIGHFNIITPFCGDLDDMFHLRAFVSERLSAAAVDIFGEVEKSLSLYQVEVSRSREEIILLRQQLELLRDNNTDPLKATRGTILGTMLDNTYIPPVLQENDEKGSPGTPVDEKEETEDYRVGREFLPGPSVKTEHDVRTSCTVTEPNPEIPQIKEEQDQFSIEVEVCPSPDVVKSEPDDRDGAEMDFTDRSLTSDDSDEEWVMGDDFTDRSLTSDDSDEEWVMGDERRHSSSKNRKSKSKEKKSKAKSASGDNKQVGSLPPDDSDGDEEWLMEEERQRLCAENQTFNKLNVSTGLSDGNELVGVTTTSPCEEDSTLSASCHFCGKSFQNIGSLVEHIKTHNDTLSNCGVCGATCTSTEELVGHLNATHSTSHFCDVCGRTFSNRQLLIFHARSHTSGIHGYRGRGGPRRVVRERSRRPVVRDHWCDVCGRAFSRKEHLVLHARTHSGEKPYACEFCGKAFSQSHDLTIHRRSHTGEKPLQCLACGKLFSTSSQLNIHVRRGKHNWCVAGQTK